MYAKIYYAGQEWLIKSNDEMTAEKARDETVDLLHRCDGDLSYLSFQLVDGGYLILPGEAAKLAVIQYIDN